MDRLDTSCDTATRPFLSIVTRTQGTRPVALKDVLLCLTGQTDTDFELLIMGHKLTPEGRKSLDQIIGETPAWLQARIRLIPVDDGNRTRPLCVGYESARGSYIATLDDDDLVFDNWVEVFRELAKAHPGTVIHANCVAQNWEQTTDAHGRKGLRAAAPPDTIYCIPFNYLNQLATNYCPPVSFALPAHAYQELGIRFDETLTTTEDWDLLMRTVRQCGVSDSDSVTSIYRLWVNAENSHTVHDAKEWDTNYRRIRDKFMSEPWVLPPGYTDQIAELVLAHEGGRTAQLAVERDPELLIETAAGTVWFAATRDVPGKREWSFAGLPDEPVNWLRLLPTRQGGVTVHDLRITLTNTEGARSTFSPANVAHNGIREGNLLHFIGAAPELTISLKSSQRFKTITVSYLLTSPVNKNVVKVLTLFSWPRILAYRLARKLLGVVRGS
ncbi:MAG: glycosyltransferase family 2 protein [Propionibacteriaceae bacterium]|jgi:glycosyltransferase involved in cell wall biosynthesis|nr:glycosyltransferase family 2 protein [Propionibacteriaceae bacterium]